MSDADELLAAFDSGELLRPSPDVPNMVDLSNAIAGVSGLEERDTTLGSRAIAALIGRPKHLVLVAADGLGMNTVRAMAEDAFLPSRVATELRTVFPSSTPVVFTSLATGQWPGAHSVIGWYMYLSELDCVATIIRFERRTDDKSLAELGLEREQAYPVPSQMARFARGTLSLLPEVISGTAYSTYTAGGTAQRGYKTLHAAVDAVLSHASDSGEEPTFTYLYTPAIDFISHEAGVGHKSVQAAAEELDREVERLAGSLPKDSRVVLTADHGLLDIDKAHDYKIEPSDDLPTYLRREPWGDGRALQFDVAEDKKALFEQIFRSLFGEAFYLISTDDAERLALFGPGAISPLTRNRLGNYMAVAKGPGSIYYRYPKGEESKFHMVSAHSGLTPDEMLVPLVVA